MQTGLSLLPLSRSLDNYARDTCIFSSPVFLTSLGAKNSQKISNFAALIFNESMAREERESS